MRVLLLFILSFSTFAAEYSFRPYAQSLEKILLLNSKHILDIASDIRLSRMWLPSSTAEATYNGFTNTISLKEDLLIKTTRGWRVRSYSEFQKGELRNDFGWRSTTIFHELAHADFDVFIEEDRSNPIYEMIKKTIPSWFRRNHRVNTKIATHELFGYMAGDIIWELNERIQQILSNHGVYFHTQKCFPEKALTKIANRIGMVDKIEFKEFKDDIDLAERYIPTTVFVKGKDYQVKTMPLKYKEALLNYFITQYDLPRTHNELVRKINHSKYYSKKLKDCYSFLIK